jgi:hypothetical protein
MSKGVLVFERTFQALLNHDSNPCRVQCGTGYVWYTVDLQDRIRAYPVDSKGERCYGGTQATLQAIYDSVGQTTLEEAYMAAKTEPVPEMNYQAIKDELAKTLRVPLWVRPGSERGTLWVIEVLDKTNNKWQRFGVYETRQLAERCANSVPDESQIIPYFRGNLT